MRNESSGSTAPPCRCFRIRSVTTSTSYWDGTGDGVARRWANRARLFERMCRVDVVHFNFGEPLFPDSPGNTRAEGRHRAPGRAPRPARAAPARETDRRDVSGQTTLGRRRVGGRLVEAVPERYTPELDAARRRTIAAFDRYAHAIFFLNPDLADVLARARHRSCPTRASIPDEWDGGLREPRTAPPLVVHAPSDPRVKGTEHIVAAVRGLEAEGVPLAFELLHGVEPSRCALGARTLGDRRRSAQRRAGTAGFAVEAMALGKPVVAALDLRGYPCISHPSSDAIYPFRRLRRDARDRLRALLTSVDERRRLGAAGRSFVEQWHDPRKVARTVIAAYRR